MRVRHSRHVIQEQRMGLIRVRELRNSTAKRSEAHLPGTRIPRLLGAQKLAQTPCQLLWRTQMSANKEHSAIAQQGLLADATAASQPCLELV
jgi:hypothetical protein